MGDSDYAIEIVGATRLDYLQLSEDVRQDEISYRQPTSSPSQHGELALGMIALAMSGPALTALTAWLLRKYRKRQYKFRLRRTAPSGESLELEIDLADVSSEAPEAQIIEKLGSALSIDLKSILEGG